MTPFPTLQLREPALPNLSSAVGQLVGRSNTITKQARGAAANPPELDWDRIQAELNHALDAGHPLPLSVRTKLEPLIARAAHDGTAEALVSRLARHAVSQRHASPRMLAALLTWAPYARGLGELWESSAAHWRAPRAGRRSRSHDWVRSTPPTDNLPALLARTILRDALDLNRLPAPLASDTTTPLARECWRTLLDTAPEWWRSRSPEELASWLDHVQHRALICSLVEALLAPYHHDITSLRPALADTTTAARLRVAIGGLGTLRGGRPHTDGLTETSVELISVWRVAHELESAFRAWGAAEERISYWRQHESKITDVQWFESSGWLALRIGGLWFAEHREGASRVFIVKNEAWGEVSTREFTRSVRPHKVRPDEDPRWKNKFVRGHILDLRGRKLLRKAILTGEPQ
jgi:hypothetical protein